VDQFFNGKIPDAISKGKFSLNVRLRYENADNDATQTAHAFTLRPRFGFTTAPTYGFQAMIEGENVTSLGSSDNYNQAGLNPVAAPRAVIADPTGTEMNQAWLSYSNADWKTIVKGGRQRIVLDNHRFVGDVGWRQNQQTYDAAIIENKSIQDVTAMYGYLWNVNRVFGDRHPAGDFESSSHLINVSYSGWEFGKFTAYSYLLRFDNAPAASSATFGGSFAGGYTFDKDTNTKINYRAEYARQVDYGNQPLAGGYEADYYNLELGGEYRRINFGGGYEELGSDGGRIGFATPLATLHAFNGWADVFLATPANGLRDTYVKASTALPRGIGLLAFYHSYEADRLGADLGTEFDVQLTRKFGKLFTGTLKWAKFNRDSTAFADVEKFWFQVDLAY
jgi:hypothetical protein